MSRPIVIAAIVLQSFACSVNPRPTESAEERSADVITAPQVLPLLWQMFDDAGRGFRHTEQAGFVIAKAGGRFALVKWPDVGEPDTARWYGAIPDGVVAIVHTHPNWEPLPSKIDIRTAQRSHLPVYVVTRGEISKTLGGSTQIVVSGDWSRDVRRSRTSFAKAGR